jgi:hypothetical protein
MKSVMKPSTRVLAIATTSLALLLFGGGAAEATTTINRPAVGGRLVAQISPSVSCVTGVTNIRVRNGGNIKMSAMTIRGAAVLATTQPLSPGQFRDFRTGGLGLGKRVGVSVAVAQYGHEDRAGGSVVVALARPATCSVRPLAPTVQSGRIVLPKQAGVRYTISYVRNGVAHVVATPAYRWVRFPRGAVTVWNLRVRMF